jgi:protein CpxP
VRIWLSTIALAVVLAASGASAQDAPARFTQLHDALHLSADQEQAWRDYQGALAPTTGAQSRRRATQQMLPTLTTPRRIALIQAAMEQDLSDLRRQGDATTAFYGKLTPDQQAVFDRQTLPSQSSQ